MFLASEDRFRGCRLLPEGIRISSFWRYKRGSIVELLFGSQSELKVGVMVGLTN